MKQLMRYKIISGRVEEKRDVMMNVSGRKERRRTRRKGSSTVSQLKRNEDEAEKRLARVINCNFGAGDLWLILKYSDERLPESREAAELVAKNFLRRARREYRKETGRALRYIVVTSDTNPKTGEKVRLHHHLVMDRLAWEVICKHWPMEEMSYIIMDGRGDYTGIARYMLQNADKQSGKRAWNPSQGLKQPIFTMPEPVKTSGSFRVPKGAEIRENRSTQDKESGFSAAYIRYVLPREKKNGRKDFPDTTTGERVGTRSSKGGGKKGSS